MKRYQHLSDEERLYIQHGLRAGKTKKQIAHELERNPSTITREVKRNMYPSSYLYTHHWACHLNRWRKRYKYKRLAKANSKIDFQSAALIEELLKKYLSPEQTSAYLKQHHDISVSHETIYRYIYSDPDRKNFFKPFLRHGKKRRRKAYGAGARASKIPDRVPISKRPKLVDDKVRIGDWECDTIFGKDKKSALVTVVERKTLFTVVAKVTQRSSEKVSKAIIKMLKPYKDRIKTLTFDNGSEFVLHKRIAKQLSAKTYFANPYSSWERGINENTNGLIRQFFPKGTNFNQVTNSQLKKVVKLLNDRPRKTRKFKTPNELFLKQFNPLLTKNNCT